MQKINQEQIRGQPHPQQQQQQQPRQQQQQPRLNIPKTPEQLFLKKNKDVNHLAIPAATTNTPLKTVKYIDELYTKQFLDEYFTI